MKRLMLPLIVLLVLAFIITSCSTATPTSQATTSAPSITAAAPTGAAPTAAPTTPPATTPSKYGGILKWVSSASPGTPIGWPSETSGGSVWAMQLAIQYLLREQIDGSLTPDLAASYEINTDPANASVTFHLQKGVKFSDGTPFNSQAVKWNYEQMKAGNAYPGVTMFWKAIEAPDDNTVIVRLTAWSNRITRGFGDSVAYIVSPTAYQKNGLDWMRWNMVGTGPFLQTDFQKDTSLTLKRNPDYWEKDSKGNQLPFLDGVQLIFSNNALTAAAMFKAGEADIITCYSNQMASELKTAGYNVITQLGGATVLVPDSMNADSPWSNAKVRQAAEMAIDKASMTKTLGYGFTQPAYQVNSSTSPAYDPSLPERTFDLAKAKQLMADAGYATGFKTTIYDCMPGMGRDDVTAIQDYLSKIGIQADLQFPEAAQAQQLLSGTWHNGLLYDPLLQWANPNTGFNFFFGATATWFKSLKKPDGWPDILMASLTTEKLDPASVKKLEDALYNDVAIIPLYFGSATFTTSKKVNDTYLGTRGANTWWEPAFTWLSK